ncbi:hypothetical protein G7Z17_g1094 [Cylindrodendrum hubeiense]|uniref:FAD-binding PCMH-type domain-containing protein n=1 Tax=Cylindrodendrum hubeiense TaxID=595255 RepID=A0A9P5LKE7_9HYPO|nr:hypothetical protein G7Z17_g1094 [Cylindrodendrum hubeiense]
MVNLNSFARTSLVAGIFTLFLIKDVATAQSTGTKLNSFQKCLVEAVNADQARVQFPNEPDYASKDVRPYNLNFQFTPAAIMYPSTSLEVAAIVSCASKNNVKVQARSGGHDMTNKALGHSDGNLVVDMKNFRKVEVKGTTGIATIGPGNTLKTLVEGLHTQGARYMPHGSSPSVGIGGHATVGGLGYHSRILGATLDVMTEAEIVIANGSIIRASKDKNSDLFWALRGAGASFGIVTEFKFQTSPEPKEVIDFTYTISSKDIATLTNSFKAYHKIISNKTLEPKLSTVCVVQKNAVIISGSFFGSEAEYSNFDLGRQIPSITNKTVTARLSWSAHMRNSFTFVDSVFPANVYFDAKDTAITYKQLPSNDTIDELFKHLQTGESGSDQWFALMDFYGGAVNQKSSDASAFPHRDVAYFFSVYAASKGETSQTIKSFVDRAILTIQGNQADKFLSYAGISNMRTNKPQQKYWGTNLPRLETLKARFDPSDLFSSPQGVKPA